MRETGLLLYGATAEALQLAIGGDAAVEELRRHRERLTGLGALLDQLGWEDEVAQRGVGWRPRRTCSGRAPRRA